MVVESFNSTDEPPVLVTITSKFARSPMSKMRGERLFNVNNAASTIRKESILGLLIFTARLEFKSVPFSAMPISTRVLGEIAPGTSMR